MFNGLFFKIVNIVKKQKTNKNLLFPKKNEIDILFAILGTDTFKNRFLCIITFFKGFDS